MHEFYHRGVVIVLMWCHDWYIETQENEMTDCNSMKADEYAQRLGELDEFDNAVNVAANDCYDELPEWAKHSGDRLISSIIIDEAQRRVMQAIKERGEP